MIKTYFYKDHLETPRLKTRFLIFEDIPKWAKFFEDKEAVELFPDFGLKTEMERSGHWIEKQLLRYKEKKFGMQALIHKESNEFIGQCGLLAQKIDGKEELEVGYHIFKKHWGNGYAPEAAKMFINYAIENNLSESIISIIDIRNKNSMRVAEKNGLVREKQCTWNGLDVFVYRIDKKI